jgi:hypothetical protein
MKMSCAAGHFQVLVSFFVTAKVLAHCIAKA